MTRLGLGLLLLALACDTQPAPVQTAPPAKATAPTAPVAEPAEPPRGTITLSREFVTEGSHGNLASIDEIPDVEYLWSIVGGTITDGMNTSQVTYDVDEGILSIRLVCKLTSPLGLGSSAYVTQRVVAAPVIDAFECKPATVTEGTSATLSWNVREIKNLSLDPGGVDVTKVGSIDIQPKETTTYLLKATNLAETTLSRELPVKVVPAPKILSFAADGPVRLGQAAIIRAEFSNGHAEIREGGQLLANGDQSPLSAQVVPKGSLTLTLTVTNEAGTSVSQVRTYQTPSY